MGDIKVKDFLPKPFTQFYSKGGGGKPCSSFHFLLLIVRGTKTDLPNNFVPLPGDVRDPAPGDLELGL